MIYQVTITETLSRTVSVEAPSAKTAEEQVRRLYRHEEIVLGSSDFSSFDVNVDCKDFEPLYQSPSADFELYYGDCMELLPLLNNKVDMVFADPPYFLSNGGISVQNGKIVSVNKGEWHLSQYLLCGQCSCVSWLQDSQCHHMGQNKSATKHFLSLLHV